MTSPDKVIRPDVLAIHAYPVAADTAGMVKLDAMENPYRLPPELREAVARAVAGAELNRYPDPAAPSLKARLRAVYAIPAGCEILIGNGSDEIIAITTCAIARPGAVVLAPEPSFVMYKMSAGFAGARFVGVPLAADFSLDLGRFLAAIETHRPALVWLAYPNNPTGNAFAASDIERIIAAAPGLVVIDEAYHVFARRSFMARLPEFPNLMVMRTVSKEGLAGIRLGYAAAAPAWIAELDKVRPPYNVNVITQVVAETLLEHHAVLEDQARRILADRAALLAELRQIERVAVFASEANFLLVRVPDAPRTYAAMKARRVLVRNFHGSHALLANCLRITVGAPEENARMIAALTESI